MRSCISGNAIAQWEMVCVVVVVVVAVVVVVVVRDVVVKWKEDVRIEGNVCVTLRVGGGTCVRACDSQIEGGLGDGKYPKGWGTIWASA